jgi:hypothetical protein
MIIISQYCKSSKGCCSYRCLELIYFPTTESLATKEKDSSLISNSLNFQMQFAKEDSFSTRQSEPYDESEDQVHLSCVHLALSLLCSVLDRVEVQCHTVQEQRTLQL